MRKPDTKKKHKRAQKRKDARRTAKKLETKALVKQTKAVKQIPAAKPAVKKTKVKVNFFEVSIGAFGFVSGGFLVLLKMPYLINIFVH